MFGGSILGRASRSWRLVLMTGATGFAVGIAVFFIFGPDWAVAALTATPTPLAALAMGIPFALGTAAFSSVFVDSGRRRQMRLFRAAVNNMTQGLCMFDRSARLV